MSLWGWLELVLRVGSEVYREAQRYSEGFEVCE